MTGPVPTQHAIETARNTLFHRIVTPAEEQAAADILAYSPDPTDQYVVQAIRTRPRPAQADMTIARIEQRIDDIKGGDT